jgi:hypothetical protein
LTVTFVLHGAVKHGAAAFHVAGWADPIGVVPLEAVTEKVPDFVEDTCTVHVPSVPVVHELGPTHVVPDGVTAKDTTAPGSRWFWTSRAVTVIVYVFAVPVPTVNGPVGVIANDEFVPIGCPNCNAMVPSDCDGEPNVTFAG